VPLAGHRAWSRARRQRAGAATRCGRRERVGREEHHRRVLGAVLDASRVGTRLVVVRDGFLDPNRRAGGARDDRPEGFPETYDRSALTRFLEEARAGADPLHVPLYSHERYNVLDDRLTVDAPDMLVIEGLHVWATGCTTSSTSVSTSTPTRTTSCSVRRALLRVAREAKGDQPPSSATSSTSPTTI